MVKFMLQSIEGIYTHGKVELTELPSDIAESRVIVTFLDCKINQDKKQIMQFGTFFANQQSTEADFKLAHFYKDIDDNLD